MSPNLTILVFLFNLLFYLSSTNNADTNSKGKRRENELKLLKEYEAFQAYVTDTVTSMISNLHQEDSCPEDEKDGSGVCQKPAPVPLDDHEHEVNSLLDRTDSIETVVLALLPGKRFVYLHPESSFSLGNLLFLVLQL